MMFCKLLKESAAHTVRVNNKSVAKSRCISSVVPQCDIKVQDFEVQNEPVYSYLNGSEERVKLLSTLKSLEGVCEECPIVIGGREYKTDDVKYQVSPYNHSQKVAKFYHATPELISKAIETTLDAKRQWEIDTTFEQRINMFQKVAERMAGEYRQILNATTMIGQAKTVIQAEIDSAAELIDFLRFNSFFAKELVNGYQPISPDPPSTLNLMRYRSLDGFVASISPFNFTAIAGNLGYTPCIMGNGVVWKPSDTSVLSNYQIFKIFKESGFPDGLVNFVPSDGPTFGKVVTSHPQLAAINFTGSVPTFQWLWRAVGDNVSKYASFPRLIGECGGKNFHLVHPSADVDSVVNSTIRSAFEYQGQKCSACSRMYVPESLWDEGGMKDKLVSNILKLKMGPATEIDSFMSAVIDRTSFNRIKGYLDHAKSCKDGSLEIVTGGSCDDSVGYFIQPTVVEVKSTDASIFKEELFGPVISVYVYSDSDTLNILHKVMKDTPYALTGALYCHDQEFANNASKTLKQSAGNFYVNDKSTGSVVGQQPFGGAKLSGTNDKAGGPHYMLRWASPQSVKQTFVPLTDISYPYMKS